MRLPALMIAAFGVSTTFATPLLGSLWGFKNGIDFNDKSSHHLEKRDFNKADLVQLPTCRRDDLQRLFTDPNNVLAAQAFCSVYIASSSLVNAVITPTYTATWNLTTTVATRTSTLTIDAIAPSETCISNTTTASDSTGSANATLSILSPPLKRQETPVAPAGASTYPSLRLSSICSCLVTPSTMTTTMTSFASPKLTVAVVTDSVTEVYTVEVTASVPRTQNSSDVTTSSVPYYPNNTSLTSSGMPQFSRGTAAGGTISYAPSNTVIGTGSAISYHWNMTANAAIAPSGSLNNSTASTGSLSFARNTNSTATAAPAASASYSPNGTTHATATISVSHNITISAGFPRPTGTNSSSSSSAEGYCNQPFIRGNGTYLARYTVQCAYSYSNLTPMRLVSRPSYYNCARECDNDARCYAFSFLLAGDAQNCYIYNYFPLPEGQADDLFNSGKYIVGSNNGLKR